jgi:hypothetical protein
MMKKPILRPLSNGPRSSDKEPKKRPLLPLKNS